MVMQSVRNQEQKWDCRVPVKASWTLLDLAGGFERTLPVAAGYSLRYTALFVAALLLLQGECVSAGRIPISNCESAACTATALPARSLGMRALQLQREEVDVSLRGIAELIRERKRHPDIWTCRVTIRQVVARWRAAPARTLQSLGLPASAWKGLLLENSHCPLGGDFDLRVVRLEAMVVVVLRCPAHKDEQRLLLSR
jgi:hypothetical protein